MATEFTNENRTKLMDRFNSPRLQRWSDVSWIFSEELNGYFMVDIQQMGHTELIILELEQLAVNPDNHKRNPLLLSQVINFSKCWVLGLYEILRKFREVHSKEKNSLVFQAPFNCLNNVFWDLEVLRMPLAKYEAAKQKHTLHWPNCDFYPDQGYVGWEVYCKKARGLRKISRHDISDNFLDASEQILASKKTA